MEILLFLLGVSTWIPFRSSKRNWNTLQSSFWYLPKGHLEIPPRVSSDIHSFQEFPPEILPRLFFLLKFIHKFLLRFPRVFLVAFPEKFFLKCFQCLFFRFHQEFLLRFFEAHFLAFFHEILLGFTQAFLQQFIVTFLQEFLLVVLQQFPLEIFQELVLETLKEFFFLEIHRKYSWIHQGGFRFESPSEIQSCFEMHSYSCSLEFVQDFLLGLFQALKSSIWDFSRSLFWKFSRRLL